VLLGSERAAGRIPPCLQAVAAVNHVLHCHTCKQKIVPPANGKRTAAHEPQYRHYACACVQWRRACVSNPPPLSTHGHKILHVHRMPVQVCRAGESVCVYAGLGTRTRPAVLGGKPRRNSGHAWTVRLCTGTRRPALHVSRAVPQLRYGLDSSAGSRHRRRSGQLPLGHPRRRLRRGICDCSCQGASTAAGATCCMRARSAWSLEHLPLQLRSVVARHGWRRGWPAQWGPLMQLIRRNWAHTGPHARGAV
jgi:hypothetical protein